MQIKMATAKQRLATVWFLGAGTLFFLVFIQTAIRRYGEKSHEVWAFFLPTIVPTLSLVVGVFVMDALGRGVKTDTVSKFFYRLTLGISIGYLAAVLLIFLLPVWAPMSPTELNSPLRLMSDAGIWLGPFQGLVAAAMGAFFVIGPDDKLPTGGAAALDPAVKSG